MKSGFSSRLEENFSILFRNLLYWLLMVVIVKTVVSCDVTSCDLVRMITQRFGKEIPFSNHLDKNKNIVEDLMRYMRVLKSPRPYLIAIRGPFASGILYHVLQVDC
jgi:hypothetical protein